MNPPVDLCIDTATRDDLQIVTTLVRRYFAYDNLLWDGGVERAIGELLGNDSLGRVFIARDQSEGVGYSALTFAFDFEAHGRIGVVTDLFIGEQHRGKGHGRVLLDHVIQAAKDLGLHRVELCVLDGNERAEGLYRSLGFQPVMGRRVLARDLEG